MCGCGQRAKSDAQTSVQAAQTVTPASTPQSTATDQNKAIAAAAIANARS